MTPRRWLRTSSGEGRCTSEAVTRWSLPADPQIPLWSAGSDRQRAVGAECPVWCDEGRGPIRWRLPTRTVEEPVITLTDTAATKVQELISAEGDDALALRVAVRPGGCSGFSYEMFFDSDIATDDVTADFDGVKVVVDPSSAQMLTGATLDYKDGLNQAGFSIDNPNAQRTCGCGSSFS
ncbi:MAG: iron-sulfur cluster insertion protein ErpA [Microthrixaceae bacterium]|nr:iron-sulfur cluster insertion protein ErpA [Microthrixaceae bacterium]